MLTVHETHRTDKTAAVNTTLGELAAAFYEAALAELNDKAQAARITQQYLARLRTHTVAR